MYLTSQAPNISIPNDLQRLEIKKKNVYLFAHAMIAGMILFWLFLHKGHRYFQDLRVVFVQNYVVGFLRSFFGGLQLWWTNITGWKMSHSKNVFPIDLAGYSIAMLVKTRGRMLCSPCFTCTKEDSHVCMTDVKMDGWARPVKVTLTCN